MDLLLWRHAEAFDTAPDGTDLGRELTPHGLQQAERVGRWLAEHLPPEARVMVSPARRTQQTALALGRPFETVEALRPGASTQDVLEAVGWPNGTGTVLAVGHQPWLGMTAAWLMCGHRQHWSVKRAAVWWLRSELRHHAMLLTLRTPEHP